MILMSFYIGKCVKLDNCNSSRDISTAKPFYNDVSICGSHLGMNINMLIRIKTEGINAEMFINCVNNVVSYNPELRRPV